MANEDAWAAPIRIRKSTKKKLDEFDDCNEESYNGKISYILDFMQSLKNYGMWDAVRALMGL